jgi:hypothetical protein
MLQLSLEPYYSLMPGFRLPSATRLQRYVRGSFRGWTEHLKFVHEPTLNLLDCHAAFVLAMACIGAQWCLEHRNAQKLYQAAMAILAFEHSPSGWTVADQNTHLPMSGQLIRHEQHMSISIVIWGYAPW